MTTAPHQDKYTDIPALQTLEKYIRDARPDDIVDVHLAHKELTIECRRPNIAGFLTFLRNDRYTQFQMLVDVCGVDWLNQAGREKERFDVVYHLLSTVRNQRVRVKVRVSEGGGVPTVTDVFSAAGWYERETYDLFGIFFEGHPDLRRLLTDYDFDGHPMRKDFPLEGKVEAYYDVEEQRVAYKPVDLPQAARHFDRVSPWQGMTGNAYLAEDDNKFDQDEFGEKGA
jgi:NADH-quinone oxidoreductase subunit C